MSGDGQSETCCPDLWDRINELEKINKELEKVASYSLLRQNDRLKAELSALKAERE